MKTNQIGELLKVLQFEFEDLVVGYRTTIEKLKERALERGVELKDLDEDVEGNDANFSTILNKLLRIHEQILMMKKSLSQKN